MGNIVQKLLQKFLVMSQLGTLLTKGNGNLVQIVLQKAQFSFPIVTNWLSRRCFGVFLVHHLAITLVIVPVLVNHRVTPLYWVGGLLLLTVGSFVISFLLDGLSRSIIKFLAERVVT